VQDMGLDWRRVLNWSGSPTMANMARNVVKFFMPPQERTNLIFMNGTVYHQRPGMPASRL